MDVKAVIVVILTGLAIVPGKPLTQNELTTLADSMAIRAKMLYNLRDNERTHTVRLSVKNAGKTVIPDSGWRLYFHSMYILYPDNFPKNKSVELQEEHIRVGMIQGDLYYLEPSTGFVAINPDEEREYDILVRWWSVQRTDFMPYWYVTSEYPDVEPRVVKTTDSLSLDFVEPFDDVRQWKRFAADRYNPYTAQDRARRYEAEDKGKVMKLVIPTPSNVAINDNKKIATVDNSWKIYTADAEFTSVADYLIDILNIERTLDEPTAKVIILQKSKTPSNPESYSVRIEPSTNTITLISNDADGMFYAAQTVRSILDGYNRSEIPSVTIDDEPRYHYRGMHIDVSRNFHGLDDIKRLIRAMAMYKMNKLHLHLTDDEGWRLEIAGLPELTEVGGKRCHDLAERKCIIPQFGSGPSNATSGSGFFSATEYKEILQFAKDHHIQVLPEFDMPGHAHAAIASMEERYRKYEEAGNKNEANKYRLSDPDDKSEYISVQQWLDNAVNPCVESVYTFIGKVMDEVIALHKDIQPLKIYNFGGDEVAEHAWEKSPKCLEFLKIHPKYNVTKGIKIYFVERVSQLAAERNLSLAAWEDGFADGDHEPIIDRLATTDNTAIPWNNIWEWGGGSQAYKLANAGYKIILAQATNIYFDHPQEPDPEERGLYWATRCTDTMKVLKFMPDTLYDNIFEQRNGQAITKYDICGEDMSKCEPLLKKENILGIQGELWSETVRKAENMDFMIFPRLVALAERAWHKADFEEESISVGVREERFKREWMEFVNTLGYKELKRLDDLNVQYRVPPPGARVSTSGEAKISTTFPGLPVQYSLNYGSPWQDVPRDGIVQWPEGSKFLIRTVSANRKRYSRVVQVFKDELMRMVDQSVIDYMGNNLNVHTEVIDNLVKVDGYMTVKLQLLNTGTESIQGGSWRIYFYTLYGARVENLPCGLKIGHVNGGLFYFTPGDGVFNGIAQGETLTCKYYNKNWIISRTDNMPNWYVTSLGMTPRTIQSTVSERLDYVGKFDTPAKWKRTKNDQYDPYTPATRYDLYKSQGSKRRPYKVVPTPFKIVKNEGSSTTFDSEKWVVVTSSEFNNSVQFIQDKLNTKTVDLEPAEKYIKFVKGNPSESDPEAYDLNIDASSNKVTITANTEKGAFYGVQTFISLVEGNEGRLVQMSVKDKPRYGYRGVMLDTARNFKPKEWIMQFLDLMAIYKLNKLHFHLTDDEGWRVEIPSVPELTQVGSKRCHSDYEGVCSLPQLGSGPLTNTSGTGFYSVEDYRDILRHANRCHIEVIPEIESPGHAATALAAMEYRESRISHMKQHGNKNTPESLLLSNYVGKSEIFSPQKWARNAMDPCMNSTYRFIEVVIDGLIELHRPVQPLKVFHIGGDEVAAGVWNDSQACSDMFGTGKPIDTNQLQRRFVQRVADIVADKNLNLASWDDGVYADDRPNPITDYRSSEVYVYPYNNRGANAKRPYEFANEGYKVVLALATRLYFDQPQGPDPEERGLYWATRFIDTEKSFGLMPDDLYANVDVDRMGNRIDVDELCGYKPCPSTNKTQNIIGLQASMFSETMRTRDEFHYMALPRLLALAERAWHKASWEDISDKDRRDKARDQDCNEFSDNLGYKELTRLEKMDYYFRIPPPGARVVDGVLKVNTKYPNLNVEISQNNGRTWTLYKEEKHGQGTQTLLLRSRSASTGVTSRHIQVETRITSGSQKVTSFTTATFITCLQFIIIMCMAFY